MENENVVYSEVKPEGGMKEKDKKFISSSLYNSFNEKKTKTKTNVPEKKKKKSLFGFLSMNSATNTLVNPKKTKRKSGINKYEFMKVQKSARTSLPKPVKDANRFIFNNTGRIREFLSRTTLFIRRKLQSERTILVFADDTSKALSIPVSNFTIGFTAALFIFLVSFGVVSYGSSSKERKSLSELSKLNNSINEKNKTYLSAFAALSDKVKEYRDMTLGFSESVNYTKYKHADNTYNQMNAAAGDIKNNFSDIGVSLKDLNAFYTSINKYFSMIPAGWPVANGGRITSGFGTRFSPFTMKSSFHAGIDIAGADGTPILAVADGKVVFSGWRSGYGNFVMIEHENGYQTAYGHNSQNKVSAGQIVKKGQTIALMGKTGRVTGTHCHFEVRIDNKVVSPSAYLSARF